MLATTSPFPFYPDLGGDPLDDGEVFFGVVNQNPEISPIQVYWDAAGTQPVAQPAGTLNGFIVRAGTPTLVYSPSDYSISVRDKKGRLIYYAPNSADFSNGSSILAQLTAFIASLASSIGSTLVGYIQAATGAVATTLQERLRREVWVEDFMTAAQLADANSGAPTLDMRAAFQAACDAVCPLAPSTKLAGKVRFAFQAVNFNSTLDLTNSRVNGTLLRDGLIVEGSSRYGCLILGQTGSGKAVIETTGSQFLKLTNFSIRQGSTNKSTIGLLQACSSTLPQTQNQVIDIGIIMGHDASANSGAGTVCCWNFGAEENTYLNTYWVGDVCWVGTSANDGTQPNAFALTSYQPLLTTHSLGMTTFSGECLFNGLNAYNAPLIFQNITTPTFENAYIAGAGSGGSNTNAMLFFGNVVNMTFHGVIEGYTGLQLKGSVVNSRFQITWGGVTLIGPESSIANACLKFDRTSASALLNSEFYIDLEANTTRPIFGTVDGDVTSTSLYSVANSIVKAFTTAGLPTIQLPANVLANAGTVKADLVGAGTSPMETSFACGLTSNVANATGAGAAFSMNASPVTVQVAHGPAASIAPATGIFTAPMNGNWQFSASVLLDGLASAHNDGVLSVTVAGQDYVLARTNVGAVRETATGLAVLGGTALIPMTAGQTAFLKVTVSGSTATVTIGGGGAGAGWQSRFAGRYVP